MPAELLERALHALVESRPLSDKELVRRLARRFEVSQQAMEYRLANLGMLTLS
jgi:Zn-dependent peptidase ImmA (M78 family)